jgi:tetratricopeptide (TPR) repeat protein
MKIFKQIMVMAMAISSGYALYAQNGEVKMREGTIVLPTYKVNPPEKAPLFSRDFAYQRAKRGVYPYAMNDNPTYEKKDSTHKALYLENDYVELCVLPDIGGRLLYAIDKTNGYDIFYHQHVIKPANVGMLGAWISGGVEWNVFHHHRASSELPVDYKLVSNPDGSKTIWLGEVEPRQRMSWAIGITLHPDKSYIEITGRLINNTMNRNSILYWSNVATHANKDYQIIFPENTDFGVYHAKNSFIRWPISDQPYCGMQEFKNGIDASWWKNQPASTSIFVYDLQDDYIGGYDHGKHAGTMLIGNHNINKGGKFWLWGPKAYGHEWDCVSLTDNDGPYVELMTSAYSDNQPDYCWINPYEVKEFTSYWYGIRDLNNVNRGNQFATVNMDFLGKGKLHLAANTTQIQKGASVVVTGKDDKVLYRKVIDIAPDKPYAEDISLSENEVDDHYSVRMSLYSAGGKELISYSPYKKDLTKPYPETVKPPLKPSEIENVEELYYVGMRNLQFHQAHVDPNDYFLEALRRDPGDTRCNTQMGIYYRERGDNAQAEKYLRKSLERQVKDYTRPANGESMYNLGLVLKSEGKYKEATDTLYRSAWDYAYASPSYYQLAQIAYIQHDTIEAKRLADMSVRYNGMNFEAKNLYSTILRHQGDVDGAAKAAADVLSMDPINFYATYEMVKLGRKPASEFKTLLRDNPESYLETALYYHNNGSDMEAEDILKASESIKQYPTVEYYQGFLADKSGDKTKAADYFKSAESLSADYVFPFRLETIAVYHKALEYMPKSYLTYYYLGNLLFDKQPAAAMDAWSKCLEINPEYAMALRNMGWGYRFFKQDYAQAADYYERAVKSDKSGSGLFLTELDEVYEFMNAPLEKRYESLVSHEDRAVKRYDSMDREIRMLILHSDYDHALDLLLHNFFCRREHIEDLHDIYVDACLLAGQRALKGNDADSALKYFKMADEYPAMHFYARLEYYARNSQIYYYTGLAYEKAGKSALAKKFYKMAADNATKDSDFNYEKALAMKKLDSKADVKPLFDALVTKGKSQVTDYVERFFESFDYGEYPKDVNSRAYYTTGLGYLGLGDSAKANEYFEKALTQRNDNVWANYYIGNLK